ncbi:MAG: hypothetical protein K0S30_1418, partial [Clostridia bacterium]|nr:hypothetical protein [Clostridia bacterium]
ISVTLSDCLFDIEIKIDYNSFNVN